MVGVRLVIFNKRLNFEHEEVNCSGNIEFGAVISRLDKNEWPREEGAIANQEHLNMIHQIGDRTKFLIVYRLKQLS